MARKAGTNGKSSTVIATTLLLPSDSVLTGNNGLKESKRVQTQRSKSAIGIYRNKLRDAIDNDHLDPKAWGIATKLDEIEDDKDIHVTVFHLLHYMEVLGIMKRATAQNEMFGAGDLGPPPPKNKRNKKNGKGDEVGDDKAQRIGAAARKVAEQAGATFQDE